MSLSLMSPTRFSPMRLALSLIAIVLLCAACAASKPKEGETTARVETKGTTKTSPAAPLDKAQQELANGIASYENGAYKVAARQLQSALTLGLDGPENRARAHKYQAFMHCVGGRQRQCREEFTKALEADPTFDLTPAEAGHPTWGPVFRKIKVGQKPVTK